MMVKPAWRGVRVVVYFGCRIYDVDVLEFAHANHLHAKTSIASHVPDPRESDKTTRD